MPPDLSVVIPVLNEAENAVPLLTEIRAALRGLVRYEVIFVDDSSTDDTVARLHAARDETGDLRIIRHPRRHGQSGAVRTGVGAARASWVATLDGDGQNDPADLPAMWRIAGTRSPSEPLLIIGWRQKRKDTWLRRASGQTANAIRGGLLGDRTPDAGCGIKIFPRAMYLDLPFFNHMHRFLGALTRRQGGEVIPLPVNHRPRLRGVSKYGLWNRLFVGIVDLIGVMWLMRRGAVPRASEEV